MNTEETEKNKWKKLENSISFSSGNYLYKFLFLEAGI